MKILQFALSASICIAWPIISKAQPLPVYTGEHSNFTRVVVGLPDDTVWTFKSEDDANAYVLELEGSDRGFDLEDFWRRIGRSRISSVTQDASGGLEFRLACRCGVRKQEDKDGHLIIDFGDPDAEGFEALVASNVSPSQLAPPITIKSLPGNSAAAALVDELDADRLEEDSRTSSDEDMFRSLITEQFASAISSGLLDGKTGHAAQMAKGEIAEAGASSQAATAQGQRPESVNCQAYDFLDIRTQAESPSSLQAIADLRMDLVDGGNRLDISVVKQMIDAYLSLGLGQEAIPLLDQYQGADGADLLSLARLVETGRDDTSLLSRRIGCGRGGHIWAAFSRDVDPSLLDADAILASLDLWPDTLRDRLGPPLVRALREKGLKNAARRVLERLQRRPEDVTDAVQLETAQLSDNGNSENLTSLSRSSDEDVAVKAIEAMAHNPGSEQHASDLAALTETLAREYRGSEQETDLVFAHVSALIAAGEYERALDELARDNVTDSAQYDDLVRGVVQAALDDADEGRALAFLIGREEQLATSKGVPDTMKLAVADRFLAARLPDPGEIWLRSVGSVRHSRDRRLTEARAALASRQPERAEIALIGLEGEAAEGLRREARAMMGDFAYLDARQSADVPADQRQDAAILAGNWPDLPEGTSAGWAAVAELATSDLQALDPKDLASFEALADEADTARSSLEQLLNETALKEE